MRAMVSDAQQIIVVMVTLPCGCEDLATFSCEEHKQTWMRGLPQGTRVKSAPTFLDCPEFDQHAAPLRN